MTATAANLLPTSRAPFEIALAAAMTDTLPVPLPNVLDPRFCPPEFLPFLAQKASVDLWYEDWTVDRKRRMVVEAPELARLKGSIAGIRRYLDFVDAELVDYTAPPGRFVLGRGPTDSAIEAWKARLPQLRIYSRGAPGPRRPGCGTAGHFRIGRTKLVRDVAWAYGGRRATLFLPQTGEEIDLRSVDIRATEQRSTETTIERAVLPGKKGQLTGTFGHFIIGRSALGGAGVRPQVITWRRETERLTVSQDVRVDVARPTVTPISPNFERVPIFVPRDGAVSIRRFVIGRSRLVRARGEVSFYERIYLSDPSVVAKGEPGHRRAVIGRTPLRFPHHTVRLLIRLREPGRPRRFVIGRSPLGRDILRHLDRQAQLRALAALRVAKAPDEEHRIDFATWRPLQFGDAPLLDGSLTFGSWVERRNF